MRSRTTLGWASLILVICILAAAFANGVLPQQAIADTWTPIRNLLVTTQALLLGPLTVQNTVYVAIPTAVGTATPGIYMNGTGADDLLVLAQDGTEVFSVNNLGDVTYSGTPVFNIPAAIEAPTDVATATPAFMIDSLAVSNLFEVRDGGAEVFSIHNGGTVSVAGAVDFLSAIADSNSALTISDNVLIDGAADAVQLTIQGHSTQTSGLLVVENSAGTDQLTVSNAGVIVATGAIQGSDGLDVAGGWPAIAGSADVVDITETAAIQDGTDTLEGIDINLTGADFTGTGNDLTGINLSMATADVQSRERAIVANDSDWEMAMDAGANPIVSTSQRWMEDGFGDTIHGELVLLNGSDDVAVDPALAQDQYGVITLVAGDTGVNCAADCSEFALGLHWKANQGGLVFETRLHFDTGTADTQACVGLSDLITLEMPASIGGSDTVTPAADDFVAFCYDTGSDADQWFALSADSTVQGTGVGATGVAPTHDVYQVLRIEVDASGGQARFYIDGTLVKTVTAGAISPDVALSPVIVMNSLTTAAKTMDLDYVLVDSKR